MASVVDSPATIVIAYLGAATMCAVVGSREHGQRKQNADLLPVFWFLSLALLVVMAVGQASDLGSAIANIGREGARRRGWYESRRSVQAAFVGAIGFGWLVVVVVSIWRVPARRRRYLPVAIALLTLCCYSVIRLVSLHHVDALVYRRDAAGIRVGIIIDLALVALIALLAAMRFHVPPPTRPPAIDNVDTEFGPRCA